MAILPTQALRHLQIETNLGSDVFIPLQVQYSEALGQPFQAQVTLACHATDVDFDDILGTNATIAIHNAASTKKGAFGYTRYVNGYFSSIAFHGHGAEGEALFQATVVPWLWFLTRTSDCRIFQNKTVPEILEEVFRDAGFSDFRKDLHGEYKPREFCVQYRETDFQFVMRLMECEGIYYHFEHENGSHLMILCDDMVCHKKDEKHEVIRFIGGASAMDRKGCINEWSFSKQVKPGRVTLNDFNFKTPIPDPNLRLLSRSTAPGAEKQKQLEIYDSHGGYEDVNEGARYARIRMEQSIADREYLCTRVEFMARESTYGSGSGSGGQFFTCSFSCIPMTCTYRSQRNTPIPKVEGPQTAIVCGPKGEELYVDDQARVKVQFHWDRYGKSDAASSCWMRVSQPWAGGGFGGMSIPRIGHEVIVDFIEGDPDRPVITGRVYNASNLPNASNAGRDGKPGNRKPKDMTQAAMMTSFKSNSLGGSGGSNEITMNDEGGAEGLFIKAQKDEIHVVGNDREDTVVQNETINIGMNRNTSIGSNQTETIGANKTITVGASHSESIANHMSLNVGMTKTETVALASLETVGAAKALSVGAGYAVTVGGAMTVSVGISKHIIVGECFEIICGASRLKMESNGKVTIEGSDIEIKSSGPGKIQAAGILDLDGEYIDLN